MGVTPARSEAGDRAQRPVAPNHGDGHAWDDSQTPMRNVPMRRTEALFAVMLVVPALGGAVCEAQVQRPMPLENGRIQQGPYMVLSDPNAGLHVMRGCEIGICSLIE